jgi:hypothetical protein
VTQPYWIPSDSEHGFPVHELVRGKHVTVRFEGVLDSRPQNGVARVRPAGHNGWIAVVPESTCTLVPTEQE